MGIWPPVLFALNPGNMITIHWSGEPRVVVVDALDGALILRDLTDEEAGEIEDQMPDRMEESQL